MCSPLPGFQDPFVRYRYQGPCEEGGSRPSLLQDAKLQPMALLLATHFSLERFEDAAGAGLKAVEREILGLILGMCCFWELAAFSVCSAHVPSWHPWGIFLLLLKKCLVPCRSGYLVHGGFMRGHLAESWVCLTQSQDPSGWAGLGFHLENSGRGVHVKAKSRAAQFSLRSKK